MADKLLNVGIIIWLDVNAFDFYKLMIKIIFVLDFFFPVNSHLHKIYVDLDKKKKLS